MNLRHEVVIASILFAPSSVAERVLLRTAMRGIFHPSIFENRLGIPVWYEPSGTNRSQRTLMLLSV